VGSLEGLRVWSAGRISRRWQSSALQEYLYEKTWENLLRAISARPMNKRERKTYALDQR
jgi:uncharacterized DUF497 family protein